jgi:hypothetical protein
MQQYDKGLCQLTSMKKFQHRLMKSDTWHLHVQPIYSLEDLFYIKCLEPSQLIQV